MHLFELSRAITDAQSSDADAAIDREAEEEEEEGREGGSDGAFLHSSNLHLAIDQEIWRLFSAKCCYYGRGREKGNAHPFRRCDTSETECATGFLIIASTTYLRNY